MECNDRSDLSHCSQFISFLPPIDLQGHLFKSLSVSIRYMLSLFAVPCNCDCTTFTYTVKDIASRKVPAPIVFIIRSILLIHSTKSFTTVKDDIAFVDIVAVLTGVRSTTVRFRYIHSTCKWRKMAVATDSARNRSYLLLSYDKPVFVYQDQFVRSYHHLTEECPLVQKRGIRVFLFKMISSRRYLQQNVWNVLEELHTGRRITPANEHDE